MRLDLNGRRLGQGRCPVHAQGSQCACRRETHRCCPPPLAPSLTYPSIDFLAHSSAARIACPSCFVSSHPSLNLDVWQPDLSRISTNSLNQPLPHSIRTRRAVAYLCLHLRSPPPSQYAQRRQFTINTRLLRSPFPQLPRLPSIQQSSCCRATPDCRVVRRICRIRSAYAFILQEWSVLMAT